MDSTPRLALQQPNPDPVTGDFVDISVLNANMAKIDGAIGATICTSSTRPGSPFNGQIIRESDTGKMYVMNGVVPVWEEIRTQNSSAMSAVTICTSTTRPASPFHGQLIRETDTKKMYVWNATQGLWDEILTVNSTLTIPKAARCRVFATANTSIPNNSLTLVTFGGESYDDFNMHAAGSSKVILPAFTGWRAFQIDATVGFAANSTGRRVLTIREGANGVATAGSQIAVVSIAASPSSGTDVQFSDCIEFNGGGKELEMFVLQNSGVAIDAAAGEYTTRLAVRQVY